MTKLILHSLTAVALALLLCTSAFAAEATAAVPQAAPSRAAVPNAAVPSAAVPKAAVPKVVVPPAAVPPASSASSAPTGEIVITEPEKQPSKNAITFEDAGDPTARDSAIFQNPDTSNNGAPPEPQPVPNRPVGDYSYKYYLVNGREYARSRDMADELSAYLKLNLPTSAYGGLFKDVVVGKEPYGEWCLSIWVSDKAVVEAALDKYPYGKGKLKFLKADYSLKDFDLMNNELIQQEIYKTSTMNVSIYQRLNKLSVSVMSSDYENLAKLCDYIAKSPFKAAIRLSVQNAPNPDT